MKYLANYAWLTKQIDQQELLEYQINYYNANYELARIFMYSEISGVVLKLGNNKLCEFPKNNNS